MSTYPLLLIVLAAQSKVGATESMPSSLPRADEPATPHVLKPARALTNACRVPGAVCVFAGGADTYGDEREAAPMMHVPVLKRSVEVAGLGAVAAPPKDSPWQVEIVARFKTTPSGAAPIHLVLLDKADPDAIANWKAATIGRIRMAPTKLVAMRFDLRPEDGFMPGHDYLLLFVETGDLGNTILAKGDVNLD